jgi:hypothetical protein
MRPYQTIVLLALIVAVAAFMHFRSLRTDPRIERVANCFVELALLHLSSDTTSATFTVQRDSVLNGMGFTELSFREMKADLEREPEKLIDVWDLVDKKLKARKEALDIIKQ